MRRLLLAVCLLTVCADDEADDEACIDTDVNCRQWAQEGECTKNAAFMMHKCELSCHPACEADRAAQTLEDLLPDEERSRLDLFRKQYNDSVATHGEWAKQSLTALSQLVSVRKTLLRESNFDDETLSSGMAKDMAKRYGDYTAALVRDTETLLDGQVGVLGESHEDTLTSMSMLIAMKQMEAAVLAGDEKGFYTDEIDSTKLTASTKALAWRLIKAAAKGRSTHDHKHHRSDAVLTVAHSMLHAVHQDCADQKDECKLREFGELVHKLVEKEHVDEIWSRLAQPEDEDDEQLDGEEMSSATRPAEQREEYDVQMPRLFSLISELLEILPSYELHDLAAQIQEHTGFMPVVDQREEKTEL
jgi:hypothetical protein